MGIISQIDFVRAGLVLVGAYVCYFAWVVYYRLYLHPLAKLKIPGPKLGAVTFLYEFYWNILKEGKYIYQIEKWHQTHGPIIRITPDEVHVCEMDDYDKIYHVGTRYYKDKSFYHSFGPTQSIFSLESNSAHRTRRAALGSLFSPKAVQNLEWLVQKHVSRLITRMRNFAPGQILNLHLAYRCVSVDVISDYAFAKPYNLLLDETFGAEYFAGIADLALGVWIFKMFPLMAKTLFSMPLGLVQKLSQPAYTMMKLESDCKRDIVAIQNDPNITTHRTIFHALLDPNAAEDYVVPSIKVAAEEASIFMAAASETTGNALEVATFHILQNSHILQKLKDELRTACPDVKQEMSYSTLERLPYLTACIKEGLRLSFGVLGRLPRVVPAEGDVFHGYQLPPGTIISSSAWHIHNNPSYFPDPKRFLPERWLSANNKQLDRYLVSFSKGSRACIGMNLAWFELYCTLGRVFREFDLETNPLSSKEMRFRDCFSPFLDVKEHGLIADVVLQDKKS